MRWVWQSSSGKWVVRLNFTLYSDVLRILHSMSRSTMSSAIPIWRWVPEWHTTQAWSSSLSHAFERWFPGINQVATWPGRGECHKHWRKYSNSHSRSPCLLALWACKRVLYLTFSCRLWARLNGSHMPDWSWRCFSYWWWTQLWTDNYIVAMEKGARGHSKFNYQ